MPLVVRDQAVLEDPGSVGGGADLDHDPAVLARGGVLLLNEPLIDQHWGHETGTQEMQDNPQLMDHDILRLKGFAQVGNKPMRLVIQAVGPRVETYFDRPLTADEKGKTNLVVIGQAGLDRVAINKALAG